MMANQRVWCAAANAAQWAALVAVVASLLSACAAVRTPAVNGTVTTSKAPDDGQARTLFVMFDGTHNDPSSRTNVFEMKQAVERSALPATLFYVEGVGALADTAAMGDVLGLGMEERINAGYAFLSARHRPGDRIVIMGFSRGAHQARALAGLVAYAGLLNVPEQAAARDARIVNRLIDAAKAYKDSDVQAAWMVHPEEPPIRADLQARFGVALKTAPIAFLGVWDTVPGSAFKSYADCREVPDARPGERYKTGSYPSVAYLAQALAVDEKRSRFAPIALCAPMRPDLSTVDEQWFAGAHADVGGGYLMPGASLSRVSLAWMAQRLGAVLNHTLDIPAPSSADLLAPAHWSIGDAPANIGSECRDRVRPAAALVHASVAPRLEAGRAMVVVKGKAVEASYPLRCRDVRGELGPG